MEQSEKDRTRKFYTADNLTILRSIPRETVDLIYLDPPFNSGKQWKKLVNEEGKGDHASFKDTWELSDIDADDERDLGQAYPQTISLIDTLQAINGGSWKSYLVYMGVRLAEMHRILKKTGSIFYHCDPVMSHGVKLLMDSIFRGENYRNEIIWHYRHMPVKQRQFQKMHDVIFFYSKKQEENMFNASLDDTAFVSARTVERARIRGYNANLKKRTVKVFNWGQYNEAVKSGELPNDLSAERSKDMGLLMNSCWTDIPIIARTAKEYAGYPTQKPVALLKRIIEAASNKDDLVLDPFCGCATTCLAAERLERQWIGIDIAEESATFIRDRLPKEIEGGDIIARMVEYLVPDDNTSRRASEATMGH